MSYCTVQYVHMTGCVCCTVLYCTVSILAALPKAFPSRALTRGYRLYIPYCADGVAAVTDADQIRTLLMIFDNEACGMKLPLLSLSSAAPMGREGGRSAT